MNKITKLFLVILSAFSMNVSAIAGELTVTGGVTATVVQGNDQGTFGKGLGISNEIDFTATGELDNGYSWKWQAQMDNATRANDDTRLEIGTPAGTVAMYISEGDLSSKLGYGIGAMGVGSDYKNTFTTATGNVVWGKNISSYNNVQYHTPADLLPLGIVAKVGYAPNMNGAAGDSAKSGGAHETKAVGDDTTQYKLTASPIDGLSIGADYMIANSPKNLTLYEEESAGAFAKYVTGPVSIGYARTGYQPVTNPGDTTTNYESDMYGIQFAVNDALTLSYSEEEFTKHTSSALSNAGVVTAATNIDMEVTHVQAAYVVGGATLGVAIADTDNDDFTTGQEAKVTTFSVAMAF
jgi:outer membrane protein OmpU